MHITRGNHTLYYEERGQGEPILFVHGGPGGYTKEDHYALFNLEKWRVILLDQRGCGKSTPLGSLEENTTWDLVSDIEALREHLKIDKWTLYGTSWGSTLSLVYAIKYPERVKQLFLRGIFLATQKEKDWVYKEGANQLFPKEWNRFRKYIPEGDPVEEFYKLLQSNKKMEAAREWSRWHMCLYRHAYDEAEIEKALEEDTSVTGPLLETHYFKNHCFLPGDNWIIKNCDKVKEIPTTIIHGRYDVMCPFTSAWDLHSALPQSKLVVVESGGHATSEEPTLSVVKQVLDQ